MNKQQLASTIWEMANHMRSKIEANEYKDFILGFVFYKFLSEKQLKFYRDIEMPDEDIQGQDGSDDGFIRYVQDNIGYFIAYKDLFSSWRQSGTDFNVSDVRDALSAFDRQISPNHRNVFEGIFKTLQTGLSKLGDNAIAQTKAIINLFDLIERIPMDGKQGYDVLGFIYEDLIGKFAANSGKKGGEFYTPHEISVLMSEIIAEHLKDREEISIYDPTSGSGSLLINIGQSVARRTRGTNKVVYYAQELIENTYNLTRMNLVMRGIAPDNLFVRNGDTLEDDWPFFEKGKPETYVQRTVDAVVSNPPYSQKWDSSDKLSDPRFSEYGVAPRGKADYAFLLHDLYHLDYNGIMTIVLPHGILFRGNCEGEIRKNLIEKNKIDAIIGLPENIFFGTQIATIIMVLKKNKTDSNVLFVDASKKFAKGRKKNILRSSDIKCIADVINSRLEIPGFSTLVGKEQIGKNGYNLNIPRYIDSSEDLDTWDLRSIMFGGLPKREVDLLNLYWEDLPGLREGIFKETTPGYLQVAQGDIKDLVLSSQITKDYKKNFNSAFEGLGESLKRDLIYNYNYEKVSAYEEEEKITKDIFSRMSGIRAIDKYSAYQILDDCWEQVRMDIEILQADGRFALTEVEPNMVLKKKENKTYEIQEGWKGRILPFDLVQKNFLKDDLRRLVEMQNELVKISEGYAAFIDEIDDDDRFVLNDDETGFVESELRKKVDDILSDIETNEIIELKRYLYLPNATEKKAYIRECKHVDWSAISPGKNGLFTKSTVNRRINELKRSYRFSEESSEYKFLQILEMVEREKYLKKEVKRATKELHEKTKKTIEAMKFEDAIKILEQKWIDPILIGIGSLPGRMINILVDKLVVKLSKYKVTFADVEVQIADVEKRLSDMVGHLIGNPSDMKALSELRVLLVGEETKISVLERLFPGDGKKVPEIRFEGFTKDWKECRFEELYKVCNERNEDTFPVEKTISVASMRYNEKGSGASVTSLRNYKILRFGDISYEGHKSKDFAYGRFVLNDIGDGIVSPIFVTLRPIVKQDFTFWKYYIHSEKVMRSKLVMSTKAGIMMHKLVLSDLGRQTILVPEIEEQIKIGYFLKCIDLLIDLETQKVAKLKMFKSAYLGRMFV